MGVDLVGVGFMGVYVMRVKDPCLESLTKYIIAISLKCIL